VARPEATIGCKKNIGECEQKLMIFIKGKSFVTVETDSRNKKNYIITYVSDGKKIYDYIVLFGKMQKSDFKSTNDKLVLTLAQYKIIKDAIKEDDETAFKLLISDFDIGKEIVDEIRKVFLNKANIITFSICSDCKKKKTEHFIYYLTEEYIWTITINKSEKGMVRISSVTSRDGYMLIFNVLCDRFNIKADNLHKLFD
jgi:hypothetical protein